MKEYKKIYKKESTEYMGDAQKQKIKEYQKQYKKI